MKNQIFLLVPIKFKKIDPLGQPTVTAGRDNCFRTCRPSVPTFQNLSKLTKVQRMFATGKTVGLAEWIIDDTCLSSYCFPPCLKTNKEKLAVGICFMETFVDKILLPKLEILIPLLCS